MLWVKEVELFKGTGQVKGEQAGALNGMFRDTCLGRGDTHGSYSLSTRPGVTSCLPPLQLGPQPRGLCSTALPPPSPAGPPTLPKPGTLRQRGLQATAHGVLVTCFASASRTPHIPIFFPSSFALSPFSAHPLSDGVPESHPGPRSQRAVFSRESSSHICCETQISVSARASGEISRLL